MFAVTNPPCLCQAGNWASDHPQKCPVMGHKLSKASPSLTIGSVEENIAQTMHFLRDIHNFFQIKRFLEVDWVNYFRQIVFTKH